MSDEPKKRSRKWIGWTLFTVFVLYPLSSGPAMWIYQHSTNRFIHGRWHAILYSPLQNVCDQWDPAFDALDWYVQLWSPDR